MQLSVSVIIYQFFNNKMDKMLINVLVHLFQCLSSARIDYFNRSSIKKRRNISLKEDNKGHQCGFFVKEERNGNFKRFDIKNDLVGMFFDCSVNAIFLKDNNIVQGTNLGFILSNILCAQIKSILL
jgi:hypothetical protein